jgi:hypothetical protein
VPARAGELDDHAVDALAEPEQDALVGLAMAARRRGDRLVPTRRQAGQAEPAIIVGQDAAAQDARRVR